MSTTEVGRAAEDIVANYLVSNGYEVIDQNWCTKWCEIDVIATKSRVIYFVEVKYRKTAYWGDGLESITSKKLQQMNFAAHAWLGSHKWGGGAQLVVASVSGSPPKIDDIIEIEAS